MPKYQKVEKVLNIRIRATTRKARDLERALRLFIDNYEDKRGVYEIHVTEENTRFHTIVDGEVK